MQRGLTRKHDYEKGKKKSQALQPNYLERFAEEGDNFDRGGSDGNRITLSSALKPSTFRLVKSELKTKAIHFYQCQIKTKSIKINQWVFRFSAEVSDFAKANNLSVSVAARIHPKVADDAWKFLEMTLGRLRKAELAPPSGITDEKGKTPYYGVLRFRTFLPTRLLKNAHSIVTDG